MGLDPKSPTKSPERKKAKAGKPKRTYAFQPTNTLAFNPRATANGTRNIHIQEKRLLNGDQTWSNEEYNTVAGLQTRHADPVLERSPSKADTLSADPTGNTRSDASQLPAPFSVKIFDKSTEQSSDDSFDGVRWRPMKSPAQKFARPILSSPLRNAEALPPKDQPAATLANEMTNSMLNKYSLAVPVTLSQTPRYSRTISDGVAGSGDSSPTLTRSKSFDPRSLPSSMAEASEKKPQSTGRLSTWIDKFETKTGSFEVSSVRPSQTSKSPYIDDDFSSDDDSFLANLRCDSLPPLSQAPAKVIPHITPSGQAMEVSVSENSLDNKSNTPIHDTDPFSDDLDIAAIEVALTQPSSASSSFAQSVTEEGKSPPSLNTKECEVKSVTPPAERSSWEAADLSAKLSYSRPDFTRYKVHSVQPTTYQMQGFTKRQLIVSVIDHADVSSKLLVRGEAAELEIKASDIVHVVHTSPDNPRLISDSHNLLIWNPDTLVSSTVVADQLDCPRKTVLSKRLSFPGSYSLPLLTGTIVHEIFQLCFITGKCTAEYMKALVEIEIQRRLLDIYTLGDVVDDLKAKIYPHLPYIKKWFESFYKKAPAEIPTNKRQQKIKFSVAETLDIEERVWSPMFGIKGIADVTLKANLQSENSSGQFLLPMEIKTGQPYFAHQAQAALYSLLFKDRYNVDISSFLLVYTSNDGLTTKHDISVPDLKSLVNLRNRISAFLRPGNQDLPDLMRQQKCDRCFVQESCMTYNYLTEDGNAEQSGLKEGVFEDLTSHLDGKQKYKDFLVYWDYLLSKEEEFISRFDKELWILTAKEREENSGKSLASLVITDCQTNTVSDDYVYTFRRKGSQGQSFTSGQISKSDRVIVSDEAGHFALTSGYVRHIDAESILISSKRQIISTESKTDKFHRAGVLRPSQKIPQDSLDAIVFRVDKDEMSYGMGVARYNILNLFLSEGDHKRRSSVVDLREPTFSSKRHFEVEEAADHFNECQLSAFDVVSRTNDYSLILGMPGTGKTTLIAHLIKMLVAAKKTVLLTSYTHSAVDNILIKVQEYGIDFLRIGSPSRVHPLIKDYTPGSKDKKVESYSDFVNVYSKPNVVAATCLSVQDPSFSIRNHFDYCIVDEASQVSMPISLGPLSLCDKFVMVGDHYQLPPLVSHPDAEVKSGLSQSLFQMLATAHPHSVVELKYQYRMCKEIMLISNRLVYKNRLLCGTAQVANQSLAIPNKDELAGFQNQDCFIHSPWLEIALDERNKVVFFDHDLLPGYERTMGENVTNPTEVELVRQTVEALRATGVDPSKIGIMTLYRSQLKVLTETFKHIPELEVLTADRFQGRDKDCIIISMVRSNRERKAGDLLRDWRRVNVAVTRARAKLLVFGSVSTLSNAESICDFVALAKRESWVHELSEDALDSYDFKAPASQTPKKFQTIAKKLGASAVARHPLVKNIFADMNIT